MNAHLQCQRTSENSVPNFQVKFIVLNVDNNDIRRAPILSLAVRDLAEWKEHFNS